MRECDWTQLCKLNSGNTICGVSAVVVRPGNGETGKNVKTVFFKAVVDVEKCMGCSICTKVCPTTAIFMRARFAVVEEYRCSGCRACVQACPFQALTLEPTDKVTDPRASVALVRPPWTIGEEKAAWVSQRKAAARELCQRAGLHPDQQICMCTDDLLAEDVAAAVLAGKTQPDDLVLAVGLRSGCTVLCLSALFRILKAAGIETKSPPANGWNWYPGTPSQDSFPDEFDAKYGALGYRFSEDKKMMNQVLSSASTDQTEISDERL